MSGEPLRVVNRVSDFSVNIRAVSRVFWSQSREEAMVKFKEEITLE